jgi:putative membrane protein
MLTILALALVGTLTGITTGLIPGIHPNTVVFILLGTLINAPTAAAITFITATAAAHSLINHLPAILIGAPDSDSALASVPGKQLLAEGQGILAVKTAMRAGLYTAAASLVLLPLTVYILPVLDSTVDPILPYLLSIVFGFMILDSENIPHALLITGMAAAAGIITLSIKSLNASLALFPLFTGIFGLPIILTTLETDTPFQETGEPFQQPAVKGSIVGTLAGILAGFLPGLGPSGTLSIFASRITERKTFIAAIGSISTADTFFAILALYIIGNPRSGASVAVQKLTSLTTGTVLLITGTLCLATGVCYLLTYHHIDQLAGLYTPVDTRLLVPAIIIGLITAILLTTGIAGIGILSMATGTGIIIHRLRARTSLGMACILIPVILHTVGINL